MAREESVAATYADTPTTCPRRISTGDGYVRRLAGASTLTLHASFCLIRRIRLNTLFVSEDKGMFNARANLENLFAIASRVDVSMHAHHADRCGCRRLVAHGQPKQRSW